MKHIRLAVIIIGSLIAINTAGNYWWNHSTHKPYNIVCNKAGQFGFVNVDGEIVQRSGENPIIQDGRFVGTYSIRFTNRVQAVQARDEYKTYTETINKIEREQKQNSIWRSCP